MIVFEDFFCTIQLSRRLRDAGISEQTIYSHYAVYNDKKQKEIVIILPSHTPDGFNDAKQKYYKKLVAAYSLAEMIKALSKKNLLFDRKLKPANDIALKILRLIENHKDTPEEINARMLGEYDYDILGKEEEV